jgi:hypothetical protein
MYSKKLIIFVGCAIFVFGVLVGVIITYPYVSQTIGALRGNNLTACSEIDRACPDGTLAGVGPNCEMLCPSPEVIPSGKSSPIIKNADIVCPPGTYKDVASPDDGYQCFRDGTYHTL